MMLTAVLIVPLVPSLWLIAQTAPEASGPSVLVTIAALVGAFTGISAGIVAIRNARSTASQGYVDQNLAAMQAIIKVHESETVRLTLRDVEQRSRIGELEAENRRMHIDLGSLRRECEECMHRVKQLEARA